MGWAGSRACVFQRLVLRRLLATVRRMLAHCVGRSCEERREVLWRKGANKKDIGLRRQRTTPGLCGTWARRSSKPCAHCRSWRVQSGGRPGLSDAHGYDPLRLQVAVRRREHHGEANEPECQGKLFVQSPQQPHCLYSSDATLLRSFGCGAPSAGPRMAPAFLCAQPCPAGLSAPSCGGQSTWLWKTCRSKSVGPHHYQPVWVVNAIPRLGGGRAEEITRRRDVAHCAGFDTGGGGSTCGSQRRAGAAEGAHIGGFSRLHRGQGVRHWVAGLEFQDGKRKRGSHRPAQFYHGSGRVHVHVLVWLRDMAALDGPAQGDQGRATRRTGDAGFGARLTAVACERRGFQSGGQHLHHPHAANCRAYLVDVLQSLHCHVDVLASDGRALLLKYCASLASSSLVLVFRFIKARLHLASSFLLV